MMTKRLIGSLCAAGAFACAMVAWAEPASGVKGTLIGRGTYEPFKFKTDPASPVDFEARAKSHIDVVVQTHDYDAPLNGVPSSTGWHTHPGPVFITVVTGQLTFYEVDDPTCTPKVVSAGEGFVDTGHGHIGRNELGTAAKDVTVAIAPVNGLFRTDLPAHANPNCPF
jgi:hypothetical protein